MKSIGAFSIATAVPQAGKAGILDALLPEKRKPQEA
jgi:hypothetical protein